MPKFKKKPVVIEAVQWFPGVLVDGVEHALGDDRGRIVTLEKAHDGFDYVSPGDWIITGVKGERYACKPDIFAATYEAISHHAPECPNSGLLRQYCACPESR
jgi:hypothetical protein